MAKKSSKEKSNLLPVVVEEGGVLYEQQIFTVTKRMFALSDTRLIRYSEKLTKLNWTEVDTNDLTNKTNLYITHVVPENV